MAVVVLPRVYFGRIMLLILTMVGTMNMQESAVPVNGLVRSRGLVRTVVKCRTNAVKCRRSRQDELRLRQTSKSSNAPCRQVELSANWRGRVSCRSQKRGDTKVRNEGLVSAMYWNGQMWGNYGKRICFNSSRANSTADSR